MHELMLIPVSAIALPSRKSAATSSVKALSFELPTAEVPESTPYLYIDLLREVGVPNFAAFELDYCDGGDA